MTLMKSPVILIATLLLMLCLPTPTLAQDFKVVVNDANPLTTIRADDLSRIFLKQTAAWPGGLPAYPIDQVTKNDIRQVFSRAVHKRDANAISAYWQRMIFSGRAVPPVQESTDADVLIAIRANPGAVGYVSASTPVRDEVKILEVTGI